MSSKPGLLAALTTTGVLLSLTFPADGVQPPSIEARGNVVEPLAQRVDRLKAKLRTSLFDEAAPQGEIENIVQFFNFLNNPCFRGEWRNC